MPRSKEQLRREPKVTINLIACQTLEELIIPNAGNDAEELELSYTAGGMKMVQSYWKTAWKFLIKLNINLPYSPAISFLGICPR